MGDPAGIGPEIILKSFSKFKDKPWHVIVVGDYSFLKKKASKLNLPIELKLSKDISEIVFSPGNLNILDMKNLLTEIPEGKATREAGKASFEYIKKAVELALADEVSAIVTAPINKKAISLAGLSYAGHTEMLAELTDTKDYAMMLTGGKIRVVLVTTHSALSEVNKFIKRDRIFKTVTLTDNSLKFFGINKPHIAVVALNPHAGEGGIFGKEEIEEISPAIEMAKRNGINVSGPYPADSLFVRAKQGEFDAVLVMYHDQGLIPVKMEGFGRGVNVTLGLPVIRTSVDHGTAYDIVEKGIADTGSLMAALKTAVKLAKSKKKKLLHRRNKGVG
mgnify:FL=1